MTALPVRWAKLRGELADGTGVDLDWLGPDLVPVGADDLGRALAVVSQQLVELLDRLAEDDAIVNNVALRRALEDVARAHSTAAPIYRFASLPRQRRVALAPASGALLAKVARAEMGLVALLASLRSEFLYSVATEGSAGRR